MSAARPTEAVERSTLLVTRNLPPLRGGMERLNLELARALQGDGLAVVGPRGCEAELPHGVPITALPLQPLAGFFARALVASLRGAFRHRPRMVLAGSGLCAPFAWLAARATGARCAVYLHGLDIIADSFIYRRAWLPFIRRCDVCLTNSANTSALAIRAGIEAQRIQIVHPGVDAACDVLHAEDAAAFRSAHALEGRVVLLSVGRLTERKGLLPFVNDVLPVLVRTHPQSMLVVIGNDAPDALRRSAHSVREAVEARVLALGLQGHVMFLGEVDDAELARAYGAADLAIFPVRAMQGDVEGFGMVAMEAAAHGLPTVAYAVGGVPDAVADGISGRLVDEGDAVAMADAIRDVIDAGRHVWNSRCRAFAMQFDWSIFAIRVRRALGIGAAT